MPWYTAKATISFATGTSSLRSFVRSLHSSWPTTTPLNDAQLYNAFHGAGWLLHSWIHPSMSWENNENISSAGDTAHGPKKSWLKQPRPRQVISSQSVPLNVQHSLSIIWMSQQPIVAPWLFPFLLQFTKTIAFIAWILKETMKFPVGKHSDASIAVSCSRNQWGSVPTHLYLQKCHYWSHLHISCIHQVDDPLSHFLYTGHSTAVVLLTLTPKYRASLLQLVCIVANKVVISKGAWPMKLIHC